MSNIFKQEGNGMKLNISYDENIKIFKDIFKNDDTIVINEGVFQQNNFKACIIFANGMADKKIIDNIILQINKDAFEGKDKNTTITKINEQINFLSKIYKNSDVDKIVGHILYGDALLLIDGIKEGILIQAQGWNMRDVDEPNSEHVIRGPREGFLESIFVNISLIRRKIINPDLKFKFRELGERTKTKICICYLESLVSNQVLDELNKRLDEIKIDGILESGYIEELIQDAPYSPFKTIGSTERPDKVAANLLEGKIAVLVDGTPYVLTLPYLFIEAFQSSEDYYNNYIFASINRIVRWAGFIFSTSIPAIYVALTTYHQEIIPTPLLLSIYASRQGVPFPTFLEALLMLFAFDLLREVGARIPGPIGSTISFVGALVLGDAAVNARIVSAPIVIIVAFTGITTFLSPSLISSINILRILFLILASVWGLNGYVFGVIGLFIHLMSVRSFGIPYMANVGSFQYENVKDTIIRGPWWLMENRPMLISIKDRVRQKVKSKK